MTLQRALLFLHAETPVHAGGDAGAGVVDLPIQREVATGFPIIKGESLKGALRERFRGSTSEPDPKWIRIFGSEPAEGGGTTIPGSLRVHEAQLVAFPAPALERTFVWVTSPLALARLGRKAALAAIDVPERPGVPPQGVCLTADSKTATGDQPRTVLGPYLAQAKHDPALTAYAAKLAELALPAENTHKYWREKLELDLWHGSDELLADLSRDCAPLLARVQLGKPDEDGKPTKTVKHGPFYSEYLPAETLLVALLEGPPDALAALDLDGGVLRVGGDESIGKGLMWCRLHLGREDT